MNFIFNLLFISIIKKIISLTPIWNLETTAENLLLNKNKTSIKLSDGGWITGYSTFILRKQIIRENNKINIKNYYKIDNFDEKETSWEDIGSFYHMGSIFICPKGSFYLTEFKEQKLYDKKPFDISGKWELLCYYLFNMFTFYLNSNLTKIYYYNWNIFKDEIDIKRNIFDLQWTTNSINNNEYPMFALTFNDNKIYLSKLIFYFNNNKVSYKDDKHIELNENLLHSEGYFLYNKRKFCWMTYNETTLISGYSENEVKNTPYGDISDFILKKNTESPFKFLDDITIESLKLIRETKYIIYNIFTNSNNKKYIGIIDIEFNKIIYNFENIFNDIKPYSIKGLFLETDSTVYRICFSGKDNNNECNSECPSNQILILDNINSNYCADKNSNDYYILKPDNIEISNCDEDLYIIQNQNECGLCKDLNIDKPYKIINEKECLNTKPENTYYIYEQLKILNYCHESCKTCNSEKENDCTTCYIGYKLVDGKCIKMNCYPSCKECDKESDDENNQHCLSCQINKLFQDDKNNCLDECLNGYYEENNFCKKCHESCKTCEKNGSDENPNCQSCKDDKFLIDDKLKCIDDCEINYYKNLTEKKCYKCHQNCETCSRNSFENNNYCLSCDQNSKFKYLVNLANISNCVEKCPNSTILNINNNQCLEKINKRKINNDKILTYILILIAGLIIIIIIICIICICFNKKRNQSDSQIMNKINIELKNNTILIEK